SLQGVAAAQAAGIQVLITDHHLAGAELPSAEAIVNPNQPGDSFASKSLAGVGVIFYLMLALRSHLRDTAWFARQDINEPNLASLLDLVALGTVADVVGLDANNRILVSQGLARMRQGHCCEGIKALCQVSARERQRLSTGDLAFALAPRLNAAGRMEDMSLGIECLLTEDADTALVIAQQLNDLNLQRREVEGQMQEEAMLILDHLEVDGDHLPAAICLYDPDWHQGVIGILASRIKERFYRPVIIFADAGDGQLKGSARSIPGLHIRDALDAVASAQPGLITRFGGHAMAAGLSLEADCLEDFASALQSQVAARLRPEDLQADLYSDGELAEEELDLRLAQTLRYASPWGQGFPAPSFHGEFELISRRIVAGKHLKLQLCFRGGQQLFEAIAFNVTDEEWPPSVSSVRAVYGLDENVYAGRHSLQLMIEYIQPLA
ncbi:MAG: DHHA1 domain-containing protein, partial [Gammaproteobacteria bacterium]|nr:DHHA1 domain-containing protein [Gammaproteobacteria bacterium]